MLFWASDAQGIIEKVLETFRKVVEVIFQQRRRNQSSSEDFSETMEVGIRIVGKVSFDKSPRNSYYFELRRHY